jgi:sulfite reductase beta subunit-like hemoprotein
MPVKPGLTQVERDKIEIGPDINFDEIARRPLAEISKNEVAMFKWTGIYAQLQPGFFMMRVRIPGGLLSADQWDAIADIAERYGQGQLCLTTRQTTQFHWLRKEDLPAVLRALEKAGLDTKNACGDVSRNVVTCPAQGVCPHEVFDVRESILALANDGEIRDVQRNLPRKHKMSVAGCGRACAQTLMNCQGFVPVMRGQERGFRQYVGGGLGARPHMARLVFQWIPEKLLVPVAQATIEFYRRNGDRRHRGFARLKILVAQLGAVGVADEIKAVLFERGVTECDSIVAVGTDSETVPIESSFLEGQVILPQKQSGYAMVRALVSRGELNVAQARQLAAFSRAYGDATLMLTARQNIGFRNVPIDRASVLVAALAQAQFATEGLEQAPDIVACVGTTMCNLAVSDTPATYKLLVAAITEDESLWREVGPLRIHLNGCPNSCAQHWIADIGLRGMRRELMQGSEEGFTLCVGGSLAQHGQIAQPVCDVPGSRVVEVVQKLLRIYVRNRLSGETFSSFALRFGGSGIAQLVGETPSRQEPLNVRNARLLPILRSVVVEARREPTGR